MKRASKTGKAVERSAAPAPAKSFEKAKPEWLPLHGAMMRFFPTYATEKAFPNEVKRLVTVLAGPDDFSVAEIADYVVRIAHGGVGLLIDAAHGAIEIEASVVDDEWSTIFADFESIRARVDQFPAAFPATDIKPEFREAARRQHDLALRLIRSLKANFRQAVDDGGAEIFGRWRDLKAPFEPVYPDHWDRLREAPDADRSPGTDMSTVTADGHRGDLTIYSVHVHPHRKQASASNRASINCKAFFVEELGRVPPTGRVIQNDLKNAAREKWAREELPDREIDRCFTAAVSETKSMGLVRRGRPPKLIHSTQ
ncbi:hypothetical protein IVB36_38780 [Bradyrhizobium sp. 35]|uniref:hypothetical protein n=1 Tax=Bradyrhizobium sp. 35 TaxID=2782670 RepID=UPI001FFAEA8C|nr:hypothetical protein [Bradyrhizobium sp. 35]MCK1456671.1 hypothetical protein [Bradyrhizobium sp. 35]